MTSRLLVDKIEGKSTSSHVIMPAGHVIQQVRYVNHSSSHIVLSGTSYVATGVQVTITPKASGNKILVQSFLSMVHKTATSNGTISLYLNGSQMTGTGIYWSGHMSANNNASDYSSRVGTLEYTTTNTDALLFELYAKSGDSNNFYVHHGNASSALIATEVQG